MQSVPFTTNAVSLSPAQAMCIGYNIMWYKACQWLAAGWLFSPGTPVSSIDKTGPPRYIPGNWNIVESSIKHHEPNPTLKYNGKQVTWDKLYFSNIYNFIIQNHDTMLLKTY